jgi:hypothetical protein
LALAWRLYLGSEIGRLGDRDRDAYRERNDYGGTVDIGVIQAVFVVERKWGWSWSWGWSWGCFPEDEVE